MNQNQGRRPPNLNNPTSLSMHLSAVIEHKSVLYIRNIEQEQSSMSWEFYGGLTLTTKNDDQMLGRAEITEKQNLLSQ